MLRSHSHRHSRGHRDAIRSHSHRHSRVHSEASYGATGPRSSSSRGRQSAWQVAFEARKAIAQATSAEEEASQKPNPRSLRRSGLPAKQSDEIVKVKAEEEAAACDPEQHSQLGWPKLRNIPTQARLSSIQHQLDYHEVRWILESFQKLDRQLENGRWNLQSFRRFLEKAFKVSVLREGLVVAAYKELKVEEGVIDKDHFLTWYKIMAPFVGFTIGRALGNDQSS
mmetsp:Transcript_4121/g.6543  ORF Transcript_4121/g.6543 Transcript_4121/m.6543 type:complete len:225 (-) Transcript_4121:60-734(-)